MKKDIHPTIQSTKVTCNSCNTSFEFLSTVEDFNVEVCSQCHPFYTGEQRIMDTAGRADKFAKRMAKAAEMQAAKPSKKKLEKVEEVKAEEVVEEDAPEVETAQETSTEEVATEAEA